MTLIICPECGQRISSATKHCVKCGYPIGAIIKNQLVDDILQDIVCMDISQLMQIKNFGKKSLEEISSRLYDLGFHINEMKTTLANQVFSQIERQQNLIGNANVPLKIQ